MDNHNFSYIKMRVILRFLKTYRNMSQYFSIWPIPSISLTKSLRRLWWLFLRNSCEFLVHYFNCMIRKLRTMLVPINLFYFDWLLSNDKFTMEETEFRDHQRFFNEIIRQKKKEKWKSELYNDQTVIPADLKENFVALE